MKKLVFIICATLLVLGIGVSGNAEMLYSSGGSYNTTNAIDATAFVAAGHFTLASNSTVTGVEGVFGEQIWNHTDLQWWIYNNNSGFPATQLASGTGSNIATVSLGTQSPWRISDITFDLGTSVSLAASTPYWLALHFGPASTFNDGEQYVIWMNNESITGNTARSLHGTEPWVSGTGNTFFSLYGSTTPVPGPATILLLSPGLMGLAAIRRRLRK